MSFCVSILIHGSFTITIKPPPKRTVGQNQLPFQSTEQLVYAAPVFDKGSHYSEWLLHCCYCVFTVSPLNDVVYSQISTFVRRCYCVYFTNLNRRPLFVVYNSQHSLSPLAVAVCSQNCTSDYFLPSFLHVTVT